MSRKYGAAFLVFVVVLVLLAMVTQYDNGSNIMSASAEGAQMVFTIGDQEYHFWLAGVENTNYVDAGSIDFGNNWITWSETYPGPESEGFKLRATVSEDGELLEISSNRK